MSSIKQAPYCAAASKYYPLVLIFFIGSGCAALIYEIVWFQLLEFVIGSTAVSLAVLLGTFMGGMCLGSLAFARIVPAAIHPLKVYAAMELGIGLFAILILYTLPAAGDLYASVASQGPAGIWVRALLCVAFLLVPAMLMGATLPCAARWVESTPQGISWLGLLYTGNLAGAVTGCVLAGFYLLRLYDMAAATFAASAINALCATLAFLLAGAAPYCAPSETAAGDRSPLRLEAVAVYATIALSGFTALGAQVVWTRLLSLLLGATVYTFSIILAVFLLGLGIGSSAGSLLARGSASPLVMLGRCQFFLIAAIAWAAFSIGAWLPYWPVDPRLSINPWLTFQLDLARCLWAVLPAACFWGASFPLALAAAAPRHEDRARMVGSIYAANTAGAIAGAVFFSVILIPAAGTLWAERILISAAALAAMLVLLTRLRAESPAAGRGAAITAAVAVPVVAALLAYTAPPVPTELFAFGRTIMSPVYEPKMLYAGEGLNSSIAVSENEDGYRFFHVSGKTEASNYPVDMRLQRMLGHLPGLLNPKPQSVLVVGFGAGVTAGSFVTYPGIERIVICEIEPLIPRMISGFFTSREFQRGRGPARRDRLRRRPALRPDLQGAVRHHHQRPNSSLGQGCGRALYAGVFRTGEAASQARRNGDPLGSALREHDGDREERNRDLLCRLSGRHPWINDRGGDIDVVLFGQAHLAYRYRRGRGAVQSHRERARSQILARYGFESAIDLLSSYAGRGPDLVAWLKGAAINTDRNLRLQYLAGMGVNAMVQDRIQADLMQARQISSSVFVGSEETLAKLRSRPAGEPASENFEFLGRFCPPIDGAGVGCLGLDGRAAARLQIIPSLDHPEKVSRNPGHLLSYKAKIFR